MRETYLGDIRVPDELWKHVEEDDGHWIWKGPKAELRSVPMFHWHGFSISVRVFLYCRLVTAVKDVGKMCNRQGCVRPECMKPRVYGTPIVYSKMREYLIVSDLRARKPERSMDYVDLMLAKAREDAGNRCDST